MKLKIVVVNLYARVQRPSRLPAIAVRGDGVGTDSRRRSASGVLEGVKQVDGNWLALHRCSIARNTIPRRDVARQHRQRVEVGVRSRVRSSADRAKDSNHDRVRVQMITGPIEEVAIRETRTFDLPELDEVGLLPCGLGPLCRRGDAEAELSPLLPHPFYDRERLVFPFAPGACQQCREAVFEVRRHEGGHVPVHPCPVAAMPFVPLESRA